DPQLVPQLRQHLLEPLRVAHGLHPHAHPLPVQCLIEAPCFSFLVLQATFPEFAGFRIDQGDLLVARVKITAYNLHRGSFLPESWSWQRTQVYSGRLSEQHFVIQSSASEGSPVSVAQGARALCGAE